jgi:hypothetical protein
VRLVHNIARVAFAVVGVIAMTYQFTRLQGYPTFKPGNFFSFFTIQSNILAATMLVVAALVRPGERSVAFDAVRGAVTFYIGITGAVFALLLSGLQEQLDTHNAFANFVVHYLIPVVVVADWIIDPPRRRLGSRIALAWLLYPFAWFVYTLVRGSATGWYPYPFVDVSEHGYGGVLLRGVAFLAAFATGTAAFAAVSDRRRSVTEPSMPLATRAERARGT